MDYVGSEYDYIPVMVDLKAKKKTDLSLKVKIGDSADWWYKVKRKSDGFTGWAYGAYLKPASYQVELEVNK